jgi:hypothetical protein
MRLKATEPLPNLPGDLELPNTGFKAEFAGRRMLLPEEFGIPNALPEENIEKRTLGPSVFWLVGTLKAGESVLGEGREVTPNDVDTGGAFKIEFGVKDGFVSTSVPSDITLVLTD